MNPTYHNYGGTGTSFPSLSQANTSGSYTNPIGPGNMPPMNKTHSEPPGFSQNAGMYKSNPTPLAGRTPLSNKMLSSSSDAFVPSGSYTSNFLMTNPPPLQNSHTNFNYPPQNFPPTKTMPQQQPVMHPTYQPNMYGTTPTQTQHYATPTNPPGFWHPGQSPHGMTGTSTFPGHTMPPTTQTSFGGGMPNDYNENDREFEKVVEHISNLKYPEKREEALGELSKKRESFQQLAVYLWHSVGTLAILLQEIVAIYPLLSPQTLSQPVSYKVCNVLGLLQCLALHQDTRRLFLDAHIPLFLYPFLNTSSKLKPFENLRVTSLGVIGALVKGDDSDAISFLMHTEIIPLCLRIMKRGQELSRTVATFIVQKILLDDSGLNYICQTGERFYAVCAVLTHMVQDLSSTQKDDQRLLRHIIRCYLRLAENPKANEALRRYLPDPLKDLNQKLITDETVKKWHVQLLTSLSMLESE